METLSAVTLTIIATNLILGVSVLQAGEKRISSKIFFGISLTITFWLIANFLVDYYTSPSISLFWARATNIFATWAVYLFLMLAYVFPEKHTTRTSSELIKYFLIIPIILTVLICTNGFLSLPVAESGNNRPVLGPFVWPHLIYSISTIIASIFLLIKTRKRLSGIEKHQITYILLGLGLTTFFALIFSAIIPLLLDSSETAKLSPLSTIFFLGFSAYAITRHGLFNIKVVVTEITALGLVIINSIQLMSAKNLQDFLLRGFLLALVTVIAYLLVKSVQTEITRRKELEELAKEKIETLKELEQRNKSLAALQRVSDIALNELDMKQMAQRILDEIPRQLDGCLGAFLAIVRNGQLVAYSLTAMPVAEKISSLIDKELEEYSFPIKKDFNLLHAAVTEKKIVEGSELDEFISPPIGRPVARTLQRVIGAKYMVAMPLYAGDEALGVMMFVYRVEKDHLHAKDVEIAKAITGDISLALQRAQAFQKLKDANEYLSQLDKMKDEFISMASHELNTPLAAIEGYLSMILDEGMGKIDAQSKEYLSRAYASSKRLAELILDLLNVSRIEQGRLKMKFSKVNLQELAESVIHELQIKADSKKIYLKLDAAKAVPEIWCDPDRIREVIVNLTGNALKFTDKGGVTISISESEGGYVRISVIDTGRGIAKEDQKKLFQKFSQVKREIDEHQGTGLGLYISRNFVELHNGKLWVESDAGKGATFIFELPILHQPPAQVEGAILEKPIGEPKIEVGTKEVPAIIADATEGKI